MHSRLSLWRRLRNSWHEYRRGFPGTFDVVPDGFIFTNHGKSIAIDWNDITQIDAGTRDCISVDLFFAVFHTATTSVVIDELVDGFRQTESSVFERWPGIRDQWLALQKGPAFQPRYEILWRKRR